MSDEKILGYYESVKDSEGVSHRVYSCKLKDLSKVAEFTTKYNPAFLNVQLLEFWIDEEGNIVTDKEGLPMFKFQDKAFMEGIYEIIEMALGYKETREQIEEWLDVRLITEIVETFLGLSQLKKNLK